MSLLNTARQIGADFAGYSKKAVLLLHRPAIGPLPKGVSRLQATANALSAAPSAPASLGTALPADAQGNRMEVQYNPSSISFSANAEPMAATYLQSGVEQGTPNQLSRPPSVVLRVDLLFDAMNVKDAFMFEKFRVASVNDLAASGAGIAKALGDGYSVQPQTNGLLAAMLSDATRLVTFQWAELSFTGELTDANAQYIMFSVSGQPIRSKITLQITQEVNEESDISYWNGAFDKCFLPEAGAFATGGKEARQKTGNLLNLNSF